MFIYLLFILFLEVFAKDQELFQSSHKLERKCNCYKMKFRRRVRVMVVDKKVGFPIQPERPKIEATITHPYHKMEMLHVAQF